MLGPQDDMGQVQPEADGHCASSQSSRGEGHGTVRPSFAFGHRENPETPVGGVLGAHDRAAGCFLSQKTSELEEV